MSRLIKTPIRNFSFHNILKCQERFKISNGVKILIISIAIFGAGFLAVLPAKAVEVDNLVVEYSSDGGSVWLPFSTAIFSETNFLPGQDVTRLIKVTNNSGSTQRIAVEAINQTNVGDLASQLDIVIKEGSNTIYSKTLKQFFDDKEIYLSSLAAGDQTQYKFNVSFKSSANDNYQGKSAGFNLLVGFQGTEGGLTLPPPGGGGGGGGLPPGLTIQNQAVVVTTDVSVLITWTTSYPATSQVIYALEGEKHLLDLTDNSGAPPKYGYERTTPESDISPKVINHSVTITGLTSGTKYYYRAVSHGSLAISAEQSFTTKESGEVIAESKSAEMGGVRKIGEEGILAGKIKMPGEAGISERGKSFVETPVFGVELETENNKAIGAETARYPKRSLFLASIGSVLTLGTGSVWVGLLILLIIGGITYYFIQRKRRKNLGNKIKT